MLSVEQHLCDSINTSFSWDIHLIKHVYPPVIIIHILSYPNCFQGDRIFIARTWVDGEHSLSTPAAAGDVGGDAAVVPCIPLFHTLDLQHSIGQHRDSTGAKGKEH